MMCVPYLKKAFPDEEAVAMVCAHTDITLCIAVRSCVMCTFFLHSDPAHCLLFRNVVAGFEAHPVMSAIC